jgi:hypothetical protein
MTSLAWDREGRVLTARVRLVPGREYHFRLNSQFGGNFLSRDGIALPETEIRFTTAR